MEVNCSPCMDLSCDIDHQVKIPMIHSALEILGYSNKENKSEDQYKYQQCFPFDVNSMKINKKVQSLLQKNQRITSTIQQQYESKVVQYMSQYHK